MTCMPETQHLQNLWPFEGLGIVRVQEVQGFWVEGRG